MLVPSYFFISVLLITDDMFVFIRGCILCFQNKLVRLCAEHVLRCDSKSVDRRDRCACTWDSVRSWIRDLVGVWTVGCLTCRLAGLLEDGE